MLSPSHPLAQQLANNRSRFNALFVEARRQHPRLDAAAFLDHLRLTVAPIVEAVEHYVPEHTTTVTDVLYNLSLDLVGQDFLGASSRYPFVVAGWQQLLPMLAYHLAADPARLVGAVTNALYTLSLVPGARPQEWIDRLSLLADQCPTVPTLLQVGQVLAWQAGLVHYRASALAVCGQLEPTLARAALNLAPAAASLSIAEVIKQLHADPWLLPAQMTARNTETYALQVVARVGAFRGFGGLFITPPTVTFARDHFVVRDAESHWLLTADAFGATFHRIVPEGPADKTEPSRHFKLEADGRVTMAQYQCAAHFPELANATSAAANDNTLAVTVPLSHAVYLVALNRD